MNDPWVVRRLSAMLAHEGFLDLDFRSHGYTQINDPAYMMSVIDRGAALLLTQGIVGDALASALKAEARRRDATSTFFGHIAYASILARKP